MQREGTSLTLKDLAEALGVSRTTVSNAFNRPDQLSPALRERVLQKATELGYAGPNPMARMLRTGRTGTVGVLFGETLPYAFDDPIAIAFLRGVSEVCEANQVSMLLLPRRSRSETETILRQAAVDGFLVYALMEDARLLNALRTRGKPLVMVEQEPLPGFSVVDLDDAGAAETIAAHVLKQGHRRVAVIAMETDLDNAPAARSIAPEQRHHIPHITTRRRWLGFAAALQAAGLNPDTVPFISQPNREHFGRTTAMELLAAPTPPTALLAMSDRLALGALEGAKALGLRVPEDVSIVGFDDIPRAARSQPPLTTMRQHPEAKGRAAATLLLEPPAVPLTQIIPTELIVRASVAPPR